MLHEVDADELLASLPLVALQALARGVAGLDEALGPVAALVVIALTGAWQHHRRGELAEQAAVKTNADQTILATNLSHVDFFWRTWVS